MPARQIFEIGWWGADTAAVDAYSLKEQTASVVYPIVFRDGTFYAVIYDNSDSGLYDLLWIVSLLLGCAVLALTLLAYNRRIARRVVAISQEVQSIGAGNLYLQLEPKGRDEISQLTASVEQMRLSLLRKTSEEQRALQQNSDLITAMSHDIRNPLTALLGYLDLAKNGQYRSEDELQSYLDAAYGKAEQLKTLTDELFRYSLLFGCKELPMQMEIYDARLLLEQLLGESRVQLQQQGFMVQLLLPQQEVQIEADVMYLKRVLDNLFDNIRKYADPAKPVAIAALIEDGALHICLSNSVNPASGRIESNKIGLRTCAAILKLLGGEFVTHRDGDDFTAEFTLPVTPPDAAQSDFYELELVSAGVMRGLMARKCDMYFTIDKKIALFLRCALKVYDVPAEEREAVISRVLAMDLAAMARSTWVCCRRSFPTTCTKHSGGPSMVMSGHCCETA